mgnify:CR=1 FL=1
MFNTPHIETIPNRFTINVHPLSGALFEEGNGLDLETYKDKGAVNWISASQNVLWVNTGSDFYNDPTGSQFFNTGREDLNINITPLVERWLGSTIDNNGLIVKLTRFTRNWFDILLC